MSIEIQKIRLAAIDAEEGALLFRDGALLALLSRPREDYGPADVWNVEWSAIHEGAFPDGFPSLESARAAFGLEND